MSHAHSSVLPGTPDALAAVASEPPPIDPEPVSPDQARRALAARHSPRTAAVLALFPGLGGVYNGSYARGVAFFLVTVACIHIASTGPEIWGFAVAFVWLFNVVDSLREARLIRAGVLPDRDARKRRPPATAAEGLGLAVVLIAIGTVAFLDQTLRLDVDWLIELWPLGLVAAGIWFLLGAVRSLRHEREQAPAADATAPAGGGRATELPGSSEPSATPPPGW